MAFISGVKKISANPDDDEGEPEYKFEWQVNFSSIMKSEKYREYKLQSLFFSLSENLGSRTQGKLPC